MCQELFHHGQRTLARLVRDPFASFVILTALDTCSDPAERQDYASRLRPHLGMGTAAMAGDGAGGSSSGGSIRETTCGKRLLSHLAKYGLAE